MSDTIKRFFSYVEIKTKLASLLPFLLGLFYAHYRFGAPQWKNTVLFFASMIFFDMATTALNNYIDTGTNHKPLPFGTAAARAIFAFLFLAAVLFGLILVLRTGLVVLLLGGLCFLIGILYTFGPAPISRMPLGEVFSGIFMGFFIPFLIILVNAPPSAVVTLSIEGLVARAQINLAELFYIALLSAPPVFGIANIMLANNICDLPVDVRVNRFTLPFYIGKDRGVRLFAALYYLAEASVFFIAVLRILPPYVLLAVVTAGMVQKNIGLFKKKQSKEETFALSVQNFVLTTGPLVLAAFAAAVLA